MNDICNNYKFYTRAKNAIISFQIREDDCGLESMIDNNLNGVYIEDEFIQYYISLLIGQIEFEKENYKFVALPEYLQ